MTSAAAFAASMLAAYTISDERFFEATALLATRFDRHSQLGDLRADASAPALLFDWFRHAESRVPDIRVWDLSCQLETFFEPEQGVYLPHNWPWDTRDRVLELTELLRSQAGWQPICERAVLAPDETTIRAVSCCIAERFGIDPYQLLWPYLCEHVDQGAVWSLVAERIDESRIASYLQLARQTLLRELSDVRCRNPAGRHEALWWVWAEVLRLLQRFPGEGIDLVEAALRSHDVGLRIQALDLLSFYWVVTSIPPDTVHLARELAQQETHPQTIEAFDRLIAARAMVSGTS